MRVLIGYSGGKDSSCAVIEHLKAGNEVTCMSYIPMFDDNIPLLTVEQYNYMMKAFDYLRSLGVEVYLLKGVSYYDWCMRRLVKGKNVGKVNGFPLFLEGKCGFAKDGKIKSLSSFYKSNIDLFDVCDIGYTADENRGAIPDKHMSILKDLGITQVDTYNFMRTFNNGVFRAPSYIYGKRDGCVLCPHGKASVRFNWFNEFPGAKDKVLYMQDVIFNERGYYPLRDKKFFIENDKFIGGYGTNISLFGETIN